MQAGPPHAVTNPRRHQSPLKWVVLSGLGVLGATGALAAVVLGGHGSSPPKTLQIAQPVHEFGSTLTLTSSHPHWRAVQDGQGVPVQARQMKEGDRHELRLDPPRPQGGVASLKLVPTSKDGEVLGGAMHVVVRRPMSWRNVPGAPARVAIGAELASTQLSSLVEPWSKSLSQAIEGRGLCGVSWRGATIRAVPQERALLAQVELKGTRGLLVQASVALRPSVTSAHHLSLSVQPETLKVRFRPPSRFDADGSMICDALKDVSPALPWVTQGPVEHLQTFLAGVLKYTAPSTLTSTHELSSAHGAVETIRVDRGELHAHGKVRFHSAFAPARAEARAPTALDSEASWREQLPDVSARAMRLETTLEPLNAVLHRAHEAGVLSVALSQLLKSGGGDGPVTIESCELLVTPQLKGSKHAPVAIEVPAMKCALKTAGKKSGDAPRQLTMTAGFEVPLSLSGKRVLWQWSDSQMWTQCADAVGQTSSCEAYGLSTALLKGSLERRLPSSSTLAPLDEALGARGLGLVGAWTPREADGVLVVEVQELRQGAWGESLDLLTRGR